MDFKSRGNMAFFIQCDENFEGGVWEVCDVEINLKFFMIFGFLI